MRYLIIILLSSISYGQMAEDKMLHTMAGGLVSAVSFPTAYALTKRNKDKALIISFLSACLIGTLKELSDSQQEGNKFDVEDLGCTIAGGAFVTIGYSFAIK